MAPRKNESSAVALHLYRGHVSDVEGTRALVLAGRDLFTYLGNRVPRKGRAGETPAFVADVLIPRAKRAAEAKGASEEVKRAYEYVSTVKARVLSQRLSKAVAVYAGAVYPREGKGRDANAVLADILGPVGEPLPAAPSFASLYESVKESRDARKEALKRIPVDSDVLAELDRRLNGLKADGATDPTYSDVLRNMIQGGNRQASDGAPRTRKTRTAKGTTKTVRA